jgi:hypothetical protein
VAQKGPNGSAAKPGKTDAKPAASSAPDTASASPTAAASGSSDKATPEADKDAKKDDTKKDDAKKDEGGEGEKSDISDVTEKPGQTYYFIGLRYGLTVIPKFMINIFVSEGATFTSNTVGAEVDIRKDGFSLIPSLTYAEYGKDQDVLFLEKNKDPNLDGNWSYVNSSLKAIYLGADLLWSAPISKNVDFEYGAGFGLGVIFGDLVTNWVYADANGPYTSSDNRHFSPCQYENQAAPPQGNSNGCTKVGHSNSQVAKVGGYTEPSWANGGSKPNVFPRILLHLAGVRIKPIKQFEGRLGLGFSITEGFWFGASGNFGLERPEKKSGSNGSSSPQTGMMGLPTLSW